ncbi:MAG: phosphatase domain-containing protein, partial [Cryomorphaceae bacterium]
HWTDLLRAKARENYKVDRMSKLIAHFPETRFALFGDDSQQDPLAFKTILEIYPKQIDAIFIRKTGSGNNADEIKKWSNLTRSSIRFCHYSEFEDIEPIINQIARDYSTHS